MKFFLAKVIFLCFISMYKCDIPVHCVKSQIEGGWEFKATKPVKKTLVELYDFTCGHKSPTHESNAYLNNFDLNQFTEEFTVDFASNDVATYKDAQISKV
jgi:hypothetical protein